MNNIPSWSAVDSPSFLSSLRTIFDAFDHARTGRIRFEDVCSQWQIANQLNPDGSQQIAAPPELLISLREISRNGLLTFDLFVQGVRLALERARRSDELLQSRTYSVVSSPPMGPNNMPAAINNNNGNYGYVRPAVASAPIVKPRMAPPPMGPPMVIGPRSFSNAGFRPPPNRGPMPVMNSMPVFPFAQRAPPQAPVMRPPVQPPDGNRARRSDLTRRHTLNGNTNAIDMDAVRCLSLLDEESALLREGVAQADRVAAHLRVRLAENERMRLASVSGTASVDLGVLTARVADARRRCDSLRLALEMPRKVSAATAGANGAEMPVEAEFTRRRYDSQGNLGVENDDTVADWLRTQNRLLTREVADLRVQLARTESERAILTRSFLDETPNTAIGLRSSLPARFSDAAANYVNVSYDEPGPPVRSSGADNLLSAATNRNLNSNAIAFLQAQAQKKGAAPVLLDGTDDLQVVIESAAFV